MHRPAGGGLGERVHELVEAAGEPADPGLATDAVVTPDKEGTYQLVCAELCGLGHTTMRAVVVVESQAKYEAWLAKQSTTVPEDLLLTTDQALEKQKKAQEASGGIDGSGVVEQ